MCTFRVRHVAYITVLLLLLLVVLAQRAQAACNLSLDTASRQLLLKFIRFESTFCGVSIELHKIFLTRFSFLPFNGGYGGGTGGVRQRQDVVEGYAYDRSPGKGLVTFVTRLSHKTLNVRASTAVAFRYNCLVCNNKRYSGLDKPTLLCMS